MAGEKSKTEVAMINEPDTIYKLIILYMLDKVSTPLTNQIISDYIIDKGYTNYFNVQKAFSELVESDLIQLETTYKSSYYTLTEAGKETLNLFHSQLSNEIREEILAYLEENRFTILDEMSTVTDYKRLESGDYLATCSIHDNGIPLLEVSLSATSEDEAIGICNHFLEKQQGIYEFLARELL